jgi:5-methylcytosine-specific restriction protein A
MMFTPGRSYRRAELHAEYGGQQQGGISTPADEPVVFIFTGEQGKLYGYQDGFRADGTFWYTGEGQIGDMEMVRGNRAIRDHGRDGKTLHLFSYENQPRGHVEYVGEATYLGHHMETAPDREGSARQAIVFELDLSSPAEGVSAASVQEPSEEAPTGLWNKSLDALRRKATESGAPATAKERRAKTYERSRTVRVYVLRRADGRCEGCGEAAPFKTPKGRPYLEPHHIRRRADAGPDHPRWVIALCPNCHRRVHQGADGGDYNRSLAEKVGALEAV